jgi:hypothetical protein
MSGMLAAALPAIIVLGGLWLTHQLREGGKGK